MEALLGSKSVEKILLFLLVNEKCYPSELSRVLNSPLTPLQKAFLRLERGEIIVSGVEGKRRVYRFNSKYPLLNELEMLLKKAYNRLSPDEKKQFYLYIPKEKGKGREDRQLLEAVWERLKGITRITFASRSRSRKVTGWNGKGNGTVDVEYDGDREIIFREHGTWKSVEGQEHQFSNVYRWTLNRVESMIGLEHLRQGISHPVFLFHLVPKNVNHLESLNAHLCCEDTYFGHLKYAKLFLQLNFRVLGPKKNEEMEYLYT